MVAVIFDRLDREIAVVHREIDALQERLVAARERLAHLEVRRATLLTLVRAVGLGGPCRPPSCMRAQERRRRPLHRLRVQRAARLVRGLVLPRDRG